MSWKKFFFGVSDPSRERIFGVTVSAIAAAVAAYGFWADFVPSAIVQRFSFYASVVVGLVSTFLLFRRLGTSGVLGPRSKSLLVRWSFIFVTPVFLIYVSWAALGHGIPAIYTVVAGTPYKEEIQLVKKRGGGRRTCDYRLEGGPFREALPSYICIDQFAFDSLPESTGMFQLFGRKSMLGILYENIRRI